MGTVKENSNHYFSANIVMRSLLRRPSLMWPTLDKIIKLSINKIYRSKLVLEKEAGGFQIIDHLIETFAVAAYYNYFDKPLPKHKSTLRLVPEEYALLLDQSESVYSALQIVIDFISGLTDSHAVRLYKTLTGNRF